MPKVVFHYFPAKGLGEGIRMLLAYGGQEFEDHRIPFDQWPDFKPSTPFGQIPVMEIDGKKYSQAMAMARYLGHKYGVAGDNIEEDFEIDQNVDFLNDVRAKIATVHYEKNEEIKNQIHEENMKNHYPFMLKTLNDIVVKNKGHLALGKLTWADFMFAGLYDYFKVMLRMPDLAKKYPAFKELTDKVMSMPQLKEYIAKAPVCEF